MGCCFSTPRSDGVPTTIPKHTFSLGPPLNLATKPAGRNSASIKRNPKVPLNRDETGRASQRGSKDLDRETVVRGLEDVAKYLQKQGKIVQAVTVGSAMNTIYFRSSPTTHDIELFLKDYNDPENSTITRAACYANEMQNGALGKHWINNASQVHVPVYLQKIIAQGAFDQGVVVFHSINECGGLRIVAAPWLYSVCVIVNRLAGEHTRSSHAQDADGAARCLHEYLERAGKDSMCAEDLLSWCEDYQMRGTREALQIVNEAYDRRFGKKALNC